ncbi:hypothetical protein [Pseudooceanicola atlanticus]|uniref:Uncharacterized protein n=1 Tax=Pseudooceanicola atlanticus TaxID=1461694 RepID=A0A0A0ED73_9RHOB|nr:hypothetical protein [Pseudooceanicola atlanticus]KGM48886.1 hypothetical protein ATO9_09265 [Pseudooceanicola atlanticus]
MTDTLIFPVGDDLNRRQVAFFLHPDITSLPDRPGIFVLMGLDNQRRHRPLYFGLAHSSMLDEVPYDPGFAQAIRYGLVSFASAYVPSGEDPRELVTELARTLDAPVNAAADALAEIEAAQAGIQAQAAARKIAAQ